MPPRARRVWRGQQLGGEVHRYGSLGAAADAMIGHGREILAFAVLALMTSPVAAAAQSTLVTVITMATVMLVALLGAFFGVLQCLGVVLERIAQFVNYPFRAAAAGTRHRAIRE